MKIHHVIALLVLPFSIFALNTTSILFVNNKECLNTDNFNIASRLTLKNCEYNNNQQFIISNGFIKSNLDPSKCLTTKSAAEGTPVMLWDCENEKSSNQKFLVQDKIYLFANRQLCLAKEQTSNNIILSNCNSNSSVSLATVIKTYNQKCLHLDNAKDNTMLVARDCDLSSRQLFFIDGFKIRTAVDVDKCLDSVYFDENSHSIFIKPCLDRLNIKQQLSFKNGNIKRGDTDSFCFTYFKGNKYGVDDPIEIDNCSQEPSDGSYLKQKFSLGFEL